MLIKAIIHGLDRNRRELRKQAKLDSELAFQKKRVTTRHKRIALVRTKAEADAPIKTEPKKGKRK